MRVFSFFEQSRAEQSRAEQSRAEQSRAEQSRAEQSRAEQSRAEQSRTTFFVKNDNLEKGNFYRFDFLHGAQMHQAGNLSVHDRHEIQTGA